MKRLIGKVHSGPNDGKERSKKKNGELKTLSISPLLLDRLKPRAQLAKRIADAGLAKQKTGKEDKWLSAAAEELGVDLEDADVQERLAENGRGRGKGRKKREGEAAELSKAEVGAMRAQLEEMLRKRINAGVSERYLAGGAVDVGKLIREDGLAQGTFLGSTEGLGWDEST